MGKELYQLVAKDKLGNEVIIELNNSNKKNKGSLELIDSGTTLFENKYSLSNYLFKKGKIKDIEVDFMIKYFHNGERYLPVIFNDKRLRGITKDETIKNDAIYIYLKHLEALLYSKGFYNYIISLNEKNNKQKTNGNYLNQKIINSIIEYYNLYVRTNDIDSNKYEIQMVLLKELYNYKQFRTLYLFVEEYNNQKRESKVKGKVYKKLL